MKNKSCIVAAVIGGVVIIAVIVVIWAIGANKNNTNNPVLPQNKQVNNSSTTVAQKVDSMECDATVNTPTEIVPGFTATMDIVKANKIADNSYGETDEKAGTNTLSLGDYNVKAVINDAKLKVTKNDGSDALDAFVVMEICDSNNLKTSSQSMDSAGSNFGGATGLAYFTNQLAMLKPGPHMIYGFLKASATDKWHLVQKLAVTLVP